MGCKGSKNVDGKEEPGMNGSKADYRRTRTFVPANYNKLLDENQVVVFGLSYNEESKSAINVLKHVKCQMVIVNLD